MVQLNPALNKTQFINKRLKKNLVFMLLNQKIMSF